MTEKELILAARRAALASYSPYSGIRVGAALLTRSGRLYEGANIENSAFSPTVCAERVAFFKAISEGERDFEAIAVVSLGDEAGRGFPPCGVCRQVMAEFCREDFSIILEDGDSYKRVLLKELLPLAFGKGNLG